MYGPKFVQSHGQSEDLRQYINPAQWRQTVRIKLSSWWSGPSAPADFLCMLAGLTNMTSNATWRYFVQADYYHLHLRSYLYHRLFLAMINSGTEIGNCKNSISSSTSAQLRMQRWNQRSMPTQPLRLASTIQGSIERLGLLSQPLLFK